MDDAGKADALANIDNFKSTVGPDLQGDATIKEHANKMPRAFCVMVYSDTYNVATGKSKVDWKNYRVLVGPSASIEACKGVMKSKVSGDFELVEREQAI